ncbi:MAG: cyanophycinase [Sphingomonadaceae bacterium]
MTRMLFLLWLIMAGPAAAAGALVIAGGAIADDNEALVRAVLDRRPADRRTIAIVPAASAEPARALARTAELFVRHGAQADEIRPIRVALVDDPESPEDESAWAANVADDGMIATLASAGVIWFTGGDQERILALLVGADGSETSMLAAIRSARAQGAVIAGTSAGAAIMSDPMLTGGDPVMSVAAPGADQPGLGRGLGFFAHGLVDQHFDARYRLPRLVRALERLPRAARIGFGIGEDTAMIVEAGRVLAVGRGTVTIVDARQARPRKGEGLRLDRVSLHLLAAGQSAPLP